MCTLSKITNFKRSEDLLSLQKDQTPLCSFFMAMITKEEIKSLIAQKQAGVRRMKERQKMIHMKMAKLVEERPELIHQAVDKVIQRLENTGAATRDIYTRWHDILMEWPVERIASLLRDDCPDTEQLRACAPFDFGMAKVTVS